MSKVQVSFLPRRDVHTRTRKRCYACVLNRKSSYTWSRGRGLIPNNQWNNLRLVTPNCFPKRPFSKKGEACASCATVPIMILLRWCKVKNKRREPTSVYQLSQNKKDLETRSHLPWHLVVRTKVNCGWFLITKCYSCPVLFDCYCYIPAFIAWE